VSRNKSENILNEVVLDRGKFHRFHANICVCVCVCARVHVCAQCVCMCVDGVCMCVCVCVMYVCVVCVCVCTCMRALWGSLLSGMNNIFRQVCTQY